MLYGPSVIAKAHVFKLLEVLTLGWVGGKEFVSPRYDSSI